LSYEMDVFLRLRGTGG